MKLTDKRYKLERGICSYIMWITIIAKNNVFLWIDNDDRDNRWKTRRKRHPVSLRVPPLNPKYECNPVSKNNSLL